MFIVKLYKTDICERFRVMLFLPKNYIVLQHHMPHNGKKIIDIF